jgi:hypothetical protein
MDTQVISLFGITEKIAITEPKDEIERAVADSLVEKKNVAFAMELELWSRWARSDYAIPEMGNAKFSIIASDGSAVRMGSVSIRLDEHNSVHTRMRTRVFPFRGFGLYWWVVESKIGDGWEEVARLPVELMHVETTKSSATAPEPPSEPPPTAPPAKASPRGMRRPSGRPSGRQ